MKVVVDLELCQGHGVCVGEAPAVFRVVDRAGSYEQVAKGGGEENGEFWILRRIE